MTELLTVVVVVGCAMWVSALSRKSTLFDRTKKEVEELGRIEEIKRDDDPALADRVRDRYND